MSRKAESPGSTAPLMMVQPFSIGESGGGPRILRMLTAKSELAVVSVCTTRKPPQSRSPVEEVHLPLRPSFGRLDSTRLERTLSGLETALGPRFRARFDHLCEQLGVRGIHSVAHRMDFWHAFRVAQGRGLPYMLSIHDDLAWSFAGRPDRRIALRRLARVWREAQVRFAASEALANAYCNRYGEREYTLITDGVDSVPEEPRLPTGRLRIYFGGLFHLSYRANLDALLVALERLADDWGQDAVSVTLRCEVISDYTLRTDIRVSVLPFADEEVVRTDMESADLLYLPLPFDERNHAFSRFSLSTKLVTYLASGLPILYHGPSDSALATLLREAGAAIMATRPEPEAIEQALAEAVPRSQAIAENALALARRRFQAAAIRAQFWQKVSKALDDQPALGIPSKER